jgi:hypothetical protein
MKRQVEAGMNESGPDITDELTMDIKGMWTVHTLRSVYLFDLDHGTVMRVPGPDAAPSISDRTRLLRSIERCRVGKTGRWTMRPDWIGVTRYFWQECTEIRAIVRLAGFDGPSSVRSPGCTGTST